MFTTHRFGCHLRVDVISLLILASVLLAAATAHSSDTKADTAVTNARQVVNQDLSLTNQRLVLHLLCHAKKVSDLEELLSSMPIADEPLDVTRVRAIVAENDRPVDLSALRARCVKQRSPSTATLISDLVDERSKGSITSAFYALALEMEPTWVPAILCELSHHGGGWGSVTRYGSTALEIAETNTPFAERVLVLLPGGKRKEAGGATVPWASEIRRCYQSWVSSQVDGSDSAHKRKLDAALSYHSGDTSNALEEYGELLKQGKGRPTTYYRLARLYESQGRQADAAATIHAGLEKFSKKNSILLAAAAEYAAEKGNTEEAVRLLNQCLAASPEYPPAHILFAEIEAKRGNRDAAIKACADTAAYCYGWDFNYIERINAVLEILVQQQHKKAN